MIKGFIFNLDGVLTSTTNLHQQAWNQVGKLNHFNTDFYIPFSKLVAEEVLNLILAFNHLDESFSPSKKAQLLQLENQFYLQSLNQLNEKNILPNTRKNILFLRKQGYKIALASSSKMAGFIIKKLNLGYLFDYLIDGNFIDQPKPSVEIFAKAAEGLGLNLNEVIVVDDSWSGMEAAKTHQIKSIGIAVKGNYSFPSTKDLTPIKLKEILKENHSW